MNELKLNNMSNLDLWVVYKDPLDAPEQYVVRKWVNDAPTEIAHFKDSLEAIRGVIPADLVNIGRFPDDDPKIVEVWI